MKKSLIALAALATVATAAQAQSSVTMYGIIDAGITTMSNVASGSDNKTATGMTNGGLSTSRWGFRGSEDLGGGLKANFNLEGEFLADTGTNVSNDSILFGRQAWVGFSGNFGDVKLGRQNAISYATGVAFDPLGGNNIGGFIAAGAYGQTRIQNAITYVTPTYSGLKLSLQTGTVTTSTGADNETAGVFAANRNTGIQLDYTLGNFSASITGSKVNGAGGTTGNDYMGYFAAYDFGVAKVLGGSFVNEPVTVTSTSKVTHNYVGAQIPVKSNIKLNVIAQEIKNQTAGKTPKVYAASAVYSLSKRTDLYGIVAKSDQDGTSTQTITSSTKYVGFYSVNAGINQTAFSVGVRHSF
jgi:predicted porin